MSLPITKRKPGQQLTQPEKIAILTDLDKGHSYDQIQQSYGVSRATISKVKREWLADNQDIPELANLKKTRLSELYKISAQILDSIMPGDIEMASYWDKVRSFGVMQDKIAVIEGKTGNVNIAINTLNKWGMMDD